MADTLLTLSQLNILFQQLTMTMLGMDITEGSADYAKVRISYQRGGNPAWKVTDDIIFLRCFEVDDSYNIQREDINAAVDAENYTQQTGFTTINSIFWSIYGPNSYANAKIIRDKMFIQEFHDTLARSNMYLVPKFNAIQRVPEKFEEQWWERVDLTMHFNELTVRETAGKTIASADIQIQGGAISPLDFTVQ